MNIKLIAIDKLEFVEANQLMLNLCFEKIKFSLEDLSFILNLKEKEIINTFFNEYLLFDQNDFLFIENFINLNLDHIDKNFVSDLIYFALDFGLDLKYKKILSFLSIKNIDNDCLVLSCLEYINFNLKFLYYEELIEKLEGVTNNILNHQNEQLMASLILYRITHKVSYLIFIQDLIEFDDSNLIFLKNILKKNIYSEKNFNITDINKIINYSKG